MTSAARPTVLLVDDEPHSLSAMRMALEDDFEVLTAPDAGQALAVMEEDWVQVVICDQRMPGQTGVEFLTILRDRWPEVPRLLITGYTDPAAMAEAINAAGVHQFLTKPWHPDQLLSAARNAARLFHLHRENERLTLEMRVLATTVESRLDKRRRELRDSARFETILRSAASAMNDVIDLARRYASFDVPVLLTGEAGTGKQELARAMHFASLRAERPFMALDLAGLPDEVIALELFGARRGVLAGAMPRVGMVQRCDRGTLYIGGVETLSPAMQLQLARLLVGGSYLPVGGTDASASQVRVICGATCDLRERVAEGRFRTDLYFALSVAEIGIPPLRARRGDVAILAEHLLTELAARHGKLVHGFDPEALEFLEGHDWPGNLRELSNEVTRMLMLAQAPTLGAELISRHILQALPGEAGADRSAAAPIAAEGPLKDRVEMFEMRILRETLTRCRWNKSRAAAELGLSRVGLRAKLDRYGLPQPGRAAADIDDTEED